MTPSYKKSTTEKTIWITRRNCRAVPAICELRGLLLGCCKQVRMYCGSETVDRTDRSNRRMQHDPDRRCSTFLREVNRCVFRPTGTWRTILPNFIQIRFETTEPWAFLKSVNCPDKKNKNKVSSDMRSVSDQKSEPVALSCVLQSLFVGSTQDTFPAVSRYPNAPYSMNQTAQHSTF